MPAYSIRLTITDAVWASVEGVPVRRTSFLLENPVGISTAKLFVVRDTPTAQDPNRASFCTIACAADIANLNEDAAPGESPTDPYRTDSFTLVSDQPSQLEQFLADARRRLESVLMETKQLDELSVTTSYDIIVN